MTQARQILEDRINTTGVTGATVVVQGTDQLVVEIPNGTSTDVDQLGKAAVLNFRPLIAPAQQIGCSNLPTAPSSSPAPSGSATGSATNTPRSSSSPASSDSPHAAAERRLTAPSTTPKSTPTATAKSTPKATGSGSGTGTGTGSATPSSSATSNTAPPKCLKDPIAAIIKADPTLKSKLPNAETCPSPGIADNQCRDWKSLSATQQSELASAMRAYDCSASEIEPDLDTRYYIACDSTKSIVYMLGHIIVHGRNISSASAIAPDFSGQGGTTEWTVALKLGNTGADRWHAWTSKYHTSTNPGLPVQTSNTPPCAPTAALPCSDFVAFTLDGQVLSAPVTQGVLDVNTQISGSFTQTSANDLARELNYGKLPLSFRAEQNEKVSATLGKKQLHAAFLAGGIGLVLVIVYSLLYYRGLGLVTIASLIVSALLTYAMLVILSKQIGFTLDLAGIAGFIVALGITADSFVVFFERIKDEVHEGRSVRVAIPRAWVRARRTILSADTVSFLAAAILYYFASADVKGFAFTLGMSTILDLVVVFLFTHPMVSWLARFRAFGSRRFTGLSSVRVGGIAITDEEPAPARRARRARPTGSAAEAATPSAVATLDEDEVGETDDPGGEPADNADDGTEELGEETRPRRHTAPQAGSAAERAAARRARMREQNDDGEGQA
jgi:preprotein translocase subunit SecD